MLDWPGGQVTGLVEAFHRAWYGNPEGLPIDATHA
jgi:hypothetical protein